MPCVSVMTTPGASTLALVVSDDLIVLTFTRSAPRTVCVVASGADAEPAITPLRERGEVKIFSLIVIMIG